MGTKPWYPEGAKGTFPGDIGEFLCGTRRVVKKGAIWAVVCATCRGGGTVPYPTKQLAIHACTRDSGRPCPARPSCGAS